MHVTMMNTMYVQAIDVAMVALYREEKYALYMIMVEGGRKVMHAEMPTLIYHIGVHGSFEAPECSSNIEDLGYIDPTKVKLRIPFQLVPPATPLPAPKPKPKAKAKAIPKPIFKQMSIARYFGRR